jgi:hypothetical protein
MKHAFKTSILPKLLLLLLFSAAGAHAQENPLSVIERSVQAIGGRDELGRIRNIRAFADCTGPNGKYTTEIYSAKNSRLIFRQVRQTGKSFAGQTNGNVFWTKDETNGEFSLADKSTASIWRSHEFQWLAIALMERFSEPSFAGRENFAGKDALKLSMKDELGNPTSVFFDAESGLWLGFISLNPSGEQRETVRVVINEWKTIGKVKLPSKVTATDKQGDFVLDFQDISVNGIDERLFAVPIKVVAMNELLELHNQQRVAHFNRDAKLLMSDSADDFTSVSNGKINRPAREKSISGIQRYFDSSTFLEWDDITPPVIRVSDDATMAYVIVHKKVRLLAKTETGGSQEETEVFAWVAIYQKRNGQWKMTVMTSTNTPEQEASGAQPASKK